MASGSGSGFTELDDYESLISATDVEHLKRVWRLEKAAPEIFQFETSLIGRIREQIQLMEETGEEFSESGIDKLTVSLYQMDLDRTQFLLRSYLRIRLQKMDLDRTQFLLRSYLRIRLQKIEKYMFHILNTAKLFNRLS